jgi:hypothetical protein
MQELIDVNKKQLDGIYNLPTDASFYVPFTGYQMGFVNQGAGGGAGAGSFTGNFAKDTGAGRTVDEDLDWKMRRAREMRETDVAKSTQQTDAVIRRYYSSGTRTRVEEFPPGVQPYTSAGSRGRIDEMPAGRPDWFWQDPSEMAKEMNMSTQLTIDSNTTVQVLLDGRVIAEAIKPYLLEDMVRYEGAGGAAIKRFVM